MLHLTIQKWKESKGTDVHKFWTRKDAEVPYSTLQKYVCPDKYKWHSLPYHIWRDTSLITVDECDSLVTECILGLEDNDFNSLSSRLVRITRERITQIQSQSIV